MKSNLTATPETAPDGGLRTRIERELARRCAANPSYSLRALARDFDIDHSSLSQILRGKRPLTARTIERLGGRLGLDADTIAACVAHEARSAARVSEPARATRRLTRDTANLVSEWHHYAILELVRLDGFRPDSRWIAAVLGIDVDAVNMALSRLLHLGLLEMSAPDRWTDRSGATTASFEDFTRAAVQRLSEQVRRLSVAAVHDVPPSFREHSSTTLAVRTARLPEAIERIARFRRELLELLESDAERDDVYQLEVSFFPVTQIKSNKERDDGQPGHEVADPLEGS